MTEPDFIPHEKKIIKIDTRDIETYSPLKERAHRKYNLGIEKTEAFTDPTVFFTNEQAAKFYEFVDFCRVLRNCLVCRQKITLRNFHSNDDNEIIARCDNCLNSIVEASPPAKEYVVWLNSIIKDYGMSFTEGFPKYMKQELIGKWCKDCNAHHTTMEYIQVK